MAGVRAGDRAAFEEIYDRYARGILAFCVHMLGSREAAEDALQQTFVSAYRALQGGESSIVLRPWLYTIARNRCLSELRARRDALDVGELATDAPVIEGLADEVQRREDLREMLDDMQRLPADQRAALVLFELGDHPQKDIATVLGVRTEKVKALVFQAREALVRGRAAREHPCRDIREQLATLEGRIPARSLLRAHIERCPGCQSFEHEVRHQRAALALILPVALTGELKNWILGSSLHSSGAVAAGVGACGGGGVAAGACGGGAIVGGATVVSSMGGAGAVSVTAAGGIAGTGAGAAAVATGAPAVAAAAATGLTAVGETVGGLSATGVVAKILTAAAIATVAATSSHNNKPMAQAPAPVIAAPKPHHRLLASAAPLAGVRTPARDGGSATDIPPAVTGVPMSVTATPLGSPASAPSSSSVTQTGATTTSTAGTSTTSASTPPPANVTGGTSTGSTPLASSNAPASGGASTAATPPATPSGGAGSAGPSAAADTSASSPSNTPAATGSGSSSAADQTATTAAAVAPAPADSSAGGTATGSPPPTPASDVAASGASTGSAATGASSGTSSSAGAATAPSTASAADAQAATAAGPGSTAAASGVDASAASSSGT